MTTLFVLAAVATIALFLADWIAGSLEEAGSRKALAAGRREVLESRDTLIYLLATRPLDGIGIRIERTFQSLPEPGDRLAVDGRPYAWNGLTVAVQDEGGLVNLNAALDAPGAQMLDGLLALYGEPPQRRAQMIEKLQDYLDVDALRRPGGAEAQDYLDAGLPQPRNAPMFTPAEIARVLDWERNDLLYHPDRLWGDLTRTGTGAGINVNTAPAPLLGLLPSISGQGIAAILEARRRKPIGSIEELSLLSGVAADKNENLVKFSPSGEFRIKILSRLPLLHQQFSLRLTPQSKEPWRIDYTYSLPANPEPPFSTGHALVSSSPAAAVPATR